MSLRINSEVPDFSAETTQGNVNFHDWIGDGWAILAALFFGGRSTVTAKEVERRLGRYLAGPWRHEAHYGDRADQDR